MSFHRPSDKSAHSYFSTKTYAVGNPNNGLNGTALLTSQIAFKIISF